MEAAKKATVAWLRQALSTNIGEAPIRSNQERDEAYEAYRALRAGGYEVEYREFDGPHAVPPHVVQEALAWLLAPADAAS